MSESTSAPPVREQALIGVGVLVVAAVLAYGAVSIPADAGYAGVGPNFLPWLVSGCLLLCGAFLIWEACTGGYRHAEPGSGAETGDWRALAWVSAGVLLNAALITVVGFVFSCALCFVLAVRGLRLSEGKPAGDLRATLVDVGIGLALSAPVFWMFTKLLSINLPGLTPSGWL